MKSAVSIVVVASTLSLIAGCSTTSNPTGGKVGTPSGTGETAPVTKEETFECDGDLILEPHLPEECIPPEPVVQEPDHIVGTYRIFYRRIPTDQTVIRVYPDGSALTRNWGREKFARRQDEWRWEFDAGWYHVYWTPEPGKKEGYLISWLSQSAAGEPNLVPRRRDSAPLSEWLDYEGIKVSDDPDFEFDLFKLGSKNYRDWGCFNIGAQQIPIYPIPTYGADTVQLYAESLSQCEALCRPAIDHHFLSDPQRKRSPEDMTCPRDRR